MSNEFEPGEILRCCECGEKVKEVHIDGYGFGDRLLEGVMFRIVDNNGSPKCIGVTDSCLPYFEGLNKKKWIKAAEDNAKKLDVTKCTLCGAEDSVCGWDYL